MKSFQEYLDEYSYLIMADVEIIMRDLDIKDEKIIVCGPHGNYSVALEIYCDGIPETVLAASVKPLLFSGGPPGQYFWIEGSLQDLIMDKVMYSDAVNERLSGMEVAGKY